MTQLTTFPIAVGSDDQSVETSGLSYPPTGNFVRRTTEVNVNVGRSLITGSYYVQNGLLSFDTSSLAQSAKVLSATLALHTNQNESQNTRNLTGEWYAWDGTSNSDHTLTSSATAFSVALTDLSTTDANVIPLSDAAAHINRSGYTKLRLHVDGGVPTGLNRINLYMYESTARPEAQLSITYIEPAEPHSYSSGTNNLASTLILPQPEAPEGVEEGDVMLAAIGVKGGSGSSCTPQDGSWTLLSGGRTNLGTDLASFVFKRTATGAEPATHTFTFDQPREASGAVFAVQNTVAASPVDAIASQANATPSTSVVAPTVTTVKAEDRLFFIGMSDGVASFTPPSGMSERIDQAG